MLAPVLGFFIGYLTAIPVGPINIAVMLKGLSNRTAQGLMIGAGSGLVDASYCGAAMLGISSVLRTSPRCEFIFRVATCALFFFFGLRSILATVAAPKLQEPGESNGLARHFFLGVLLYLSNPSFIAFWITVSGIVQGLGVLERSVCNHLLFALGTGVGTTAWFFTLLELVKKQKMKCDKRVLYAISRAFGIILLIISCWMGYNLIAR